MELSHSLISSAAELSTVAGPDLFKRRRRGEPLRENASLQWMFYLPDSIEMLRSEISASDNSLLPRHSFQTASSPVFTDNRLGAAPDFDFLVLDGDRYYFPAVVLDERHTPQIMVWARLAACDALQLITAVKSKEPFAGFGLLSNQIIEGSGHFGIFSLVRLSYALPMGCLCITSSPEVYTPCPPFSLARLTSALSDPQRFESCNGECIPQSALLFLKALNEGDMTAAEALLDQNATEWTFNGSALFSAGKFCTTRGQHSRAAGFFHQAQCLDHPDALKEEWESISRLSRPFREQHREAFEHIERGERFRALTVLRDAAQKSPLVGNAVLSYCLRNAGVPEEGLAAAEKSLQSIEPHGRLRQTYVHNRDRNSS